MELSKRTQIILVIALLGIFWYLKGFGLLQSLLYPDTSYIPYAESEATCTAGKYWVVDNGGIGCDLHYGDYMFHFNGDLSTAQDFQYKDFKAYIGALCTVNNLNRCDWSSVDVMVNGVNVADFLPVGMTGEERWYLFEMKHSKIDSTNLHFYVDGSEVGQSTIPGALKLTFSSPSNQAGGGAAIMKTPGYKPIFGCPTNEILAMETFAPGSTICIDSLRYQTGLIFCEEHPPIITTSSGSSTDELMEIPTMLVNDQCYTVPADRTVTVLYKFDNSQGVVSVTCKEGEAVNINGGCGSYSGVAQICSAGTFDPVQGVCTVVSYTNQTGTLTPVCEAGRYDLNLNACVYNPPVQEVCQQGTLTDGQCVLELSIDSTCPPGYDYNAETLTCSLPISETGLILSPSAQETQTRISTTYPSITGGVTVSTNGTLQPTETGLKGWIQTLINYILILFVIALALNVFLYVIQPGGVSWNSVKAYLRRNKEGLIFGGILGAVAVYYVMGFTDYATMAWVAATFGLIGMMADHLFNPRK